MAVFLDYTRENWPNHMMWPIYYADILFWNIDWCLVRWIYMEEKARDTDNIEIEIEDRDIDKVPDITWKTVVLQNFILFPGKQSWWSSIIKRLPV